MVRPELEPLIERTRRLFAAGAGGQGLALIQVRAIRALEDPPLAPLDRWDFDPDGRLADYLNARAKRLQTYWQRRAALDDDLLPTIAPWYGIAEHSAFLGGDVEVTADTSYHHAFLEASADWTQLALDPTNRWFRMVMDGITWYRENWSDVFIPRLRGIHGPLDLANALRGNDLFYDLYDDPAAARALVDFCAKAAVFSLREQIRRAGMYAGGVISGFDVWLPGYSAGQFSEDASGFCSPDQYAEFGAPTLTAALEPFDCGFLHTHTMGHRILPQFVAQPKLTALEISSDPNSARAVDILRQYSDQLRDRIVIIQPDAAELRANLDLWRQHRVIFWYEAATLAEAEEAVAWVRRELYS